MKIRKVKVADLVPDPQNARTHNERNIQAITASLAAFGQVEPVLIQKGTNKIIGGHGRVLAMQAAGTDTAYVVELELDDEKARALNLALNRSGELAGWDNGLRGAALESLPDELRLVTGFTAEESALLTAAGEDPPMPNAPKGADEVEGGTARKGAYKEQYGIIVICKDAAHQERVYQKLHDAGYQVRVVAT